jgi:hypothetical protein
MPAVRLIPTKELKLLVHFARLGRQYAELRNRAGLEPYCSEQEYHLVEDIIKGLHLGRRRRPEATQ